ncbi:MAG: hypothetical protein IPJ51_16845 [Saprospiraceae bacterium]|nr:hypothetical protein [Saprospiraceae bacterium]
MDIIYKNNVVDIKFVQNLKISNLILHWQIYNEFNFFEKPYEETKENKKFRGDVIDNFLRNLKRNM